MVVDDEVDDLIGAWQRERPDLAVQPMAIWSRIKRLEQHLAAARRSAYAAHGLDEAEFDVLAALRRSGLPYQLSAGQLVVANHVTSGTMTNRIDKLVARGFVERVAHPDDGRQVLVRLTPAGREVVDAALSSLLAVEEELLDRLPIGSRDQLAADLRTLLLAQQN